MTGSETEFGSQQPDEPVTASLRSTLSDACDAAVESAKAYAHPYLARLMRRLHFQLAGYALTVLATIWAVIALTLAAAQYLPLWASFLCVAAILAVGAAGAFIIPSLENGKPASGSDNHLEGG